MLVQVTYMLSTSKGKEGSSEGYDGTTPVKMGYGTSACASSRHIGPGIQRELYRDMLVINELYWAITLFLCTFMFIYYT